MPPPFFLRAIRQMEPFFVFESGGSFSGRDPRNHPANHNGGSEQHQQDERYGSHGEE